MSGAHPELSVLDDLAEIEEQLARVLHLPPRQRGATERQLRRKLKSLGALIADRYAADVDPAFAAGAGALRP